MKPIQERAELVLFQALKCVQYRLPNQHRLKPIAYLHALALRYGLVGAAAGHYILETADSGEERELRGLFQYWPLMVSEHYRDEVAYRVPYPELNDSTVPVGKLSQGPMKLGLALRKQLLPFHRILETSADAFYRDYRHDLTSESWILQKKQAARIFKECAEETIRYSLCFVDRRRAGLDEVSEIALLGE